MGKIFCITGIDGSGKSTLTKSLIKQGWVVVGHSKETIGKPFEFAATMVKNVNQKHVVGKFSEELLLSFFLTMCLAKIECATELVNITGKNVILDDYYYKWIAREIVRGTISKEKFNHYFAHAPKPDYTIVLNRDPKNCYNPRKAYNRCEYLRFKRDFVAFQSDTFDVLKELIDCAHSIVNANEKPKKVMNNVIELINSSAKC